MIRNFILVALRNMHREKVYAILNLFGLATAIATALVIYSYVEYELSFDKFHLEYQNIYRITEEFEDDAQEIESAMSHSPVAEILAHQLAGATRVVRILPQSGYVSIDNQTKYKENKFCFVDSVFFEVFTTVLINGSIKEALSAPFSVVLSEQMAIKYFGTTDVVGKEIFLRDETRSHSYAITAVIKDFPENSHMEIDFLASFSTLRTIMPWHNNWQHPPMYVYVKTQAKELITELDAKIAQTISRHQPDYIKEENRKFGTQEIASIHLHSDMLYEWKANSSFQYIILFIVAGTFIVLIAAVNFINLSTAQAFKRMREIGVRKVFGSFRSQLIVQFLIEAIVFVVASFMLSWVIAELSLELLYNDIVGIDLELPSVLSWVNGIVILLFVLILSILSGLYPAFYLSKFIPIKALKGILPVDYSTRFDFRKSLVTFQFLTSTLLILGTMIISQQVHLLKNKDLGFDKDHVIAIKLNDRFAQNNYAVLRDQLLQQSEVVNAGLSSAIFGSEGSFHGFDVTPENVKPINLKTLGVDERFIQTYGIKILQGRNFSEDIVNDQEEGFILNVAAAKSLGWTDPIDKKLSLTIYINGAVQRTGRVIGLVEDFNFRSLHSSVEPLLLYINKHPYYAEYLSVNLRTRHIGQSVEMLQSTWKKFNPNKPLEFVFLNENLNQLYLTEIKTEKIFNSLALISIIIACLGLFGLSSYTAAKRSKEMGLRKVFGASILEIIFLQAKEYVVLLVLANIIVLPFCWFVGNEWLSQFAYHIRIEPTIFLLAFLSTLVLALTTISYHAIKLALTNPIETIRYE